MYDSGELEVLGQEECRHLLQETKIGRFVFMDQVLYAVHPVRYVLDGGRIMFRTESGAKVQAAALGKIVSFEIDHIDPINGHGWSVLASGPAEAVTDPYEVEHVTETLPHPWASNYGTDVVCVHVEVLQGRRFRAPAQSIR
jgi:hypothetical protein